METVEDIHYLSVTKKEKNNVQIHQFFMLPALNLKMWLLDAKDFEMF